MFTCCPHCKTCFRITKAQLAVAQGKVRCGTCSQIFNAREHLHETLPTRPTADSQPPPAPRPAAPKTPAAPPSSSPSTPASEPARIETGTPSSGPDLDLFVPGGQAKSEAEDTGIKAEAETEDTAVIGLDDWNALNQPPATGETGETPAAEFHAPVHEPVSPPGDEDEMEIDLFDDEEPVEDTSVIDLSNAPDPFAPHAGVPLNRRPPAYTEDEPDTDEDDAFLFDDEEAEDDTAVIDMREEAARLDALLAADETEEDRPQPPASKAATSQDEATMDDGLFAPEDLFRPPSEAADEPPPEAEPLPDEKTAESNPPPVSPPEAGRYAYVDPEDLQPEEKQIDEIIAEMNAQLIEDTAAIEDTGAEEPGGSPPESAAKTGEPPAEDDFASRFLAELDDTLSQPLPDAPTPDKAPPSPRPESNKPAEVVERLDPASQRYEGMVPEDDEIPLPLREHLVTEGPTHHPLRFGLQFLTALALLAALGAQLAFFRSAEIANAVPALRPLLEQVCSRLPCQYHGPVDVDQIQLVSRDIRDHPQEPGALRIKATLVNRAPFAQPFPDMEITLSDLAGEVVARRRFHPKEYLGSYWHPFILMRPGQPVRITLDVLNPGQDAVNFEFRFLPSAQTLQPK